VRDLDANGSAYTEPDTNTDDAADAATNYAADGCADAAANVDADGYHDDAVHAADGG
jgi:hypothetical protein